MYQRGVIIQGFYCAVKMLRLLILLKPEKKIIVCIFSFQN